MGSWHLAEPDGEVRSAGAAFEPLLRELPGGGPLAALAARAPRLTERAYRLVSGNRTPIGRRLTRRREAPCRREDRETAGLASRGRMTESVHEQQTESS